MHNQTPSDKKDRSGGGDVTKATKVNTPAVTTKTDWENVNSHGPTDYDKEY